MAMQGGSGAEAARAQLGYYRFPAIHGDTVVFAAEGDFWVVDAAGGRAARLTSHPGDVGHPAISPDGLTLAFSAAYEGPVEVYTMPLAGGLPTRRTYEGMNALVQGWTPDGRILYANGAFSTLPSLRLFVFDPATGAKEPVPLAQAAEGAYTPDGATLFFTRLGAQSSHTKRYTGGTAQNLWRYRDGDEEATPLTADYAGTSRGPMFHDGRLFFVSDRSGWMNLWSMDPDGGDLRRHTSHDGWDVLSPRLDGGRIVYQLGADLWIHEIASGESRAMEIRLPSDFDEIRETWVKKPLEYLSSIALSPKGDRIALVARGQAFVVPVKQGRFVEVTRKPGVRYRNARFMPDGKSLLALSDETGEVELWRLPANGVGPGEPLTTGGSRLRWEGVPSPDGKWIAHHDKSCRLWLLEVETKQETLVAASTMGDFADLRWSPDSRWLAYSMPAPNGFHRIHLFRLETGECTPVTSDRYDSASSTWSRDGEWLYFLSDRHLQTLVPSPWGPRQPDPFLSAPTRIYAIALKQASRFPFKPLDELAPETPEEKKKEGEEKKPDAAVEVKIDFDGIGSRLYLVPVPPGNYRSLSASPDRLFWISTDLSFERKQSLQTLPIGPEKPKIKAVMEEIADYRLSDDGKKLLVRKGESFFCFDAGEKPSEPLDASKVDLNGWSFSFDPREQLRQMFLEAWRLERDYFYDPGMHGLDWPAIREKYRPLAERVTGRSELSDLLAQMIGELSALHMFVTGGDLRASGDRIGVGSLGADLHRDEEAGGYRIQRIYRSDPDLPEEASPLDRPDIRIREGEVITAIDGVDALAVADPGVLLRNRAGKQVLLRVHPPSTGVARDVVVVPIAQNQAESLRYTHWEMERRRRVEEMGDGRIGYLHLRAMGGGNFAEFARDYYPVFHREGLVLDVRNNSGGNIDSWLLGKLMRKAWFFWKPPVGDPTWNMQYAFRGHMVVLVNEHTASDGEAFAEGFRRLGLGKVIGTRTWGGEIWLTGSNVLVDRGVATAAEIGVFGPEGEWLIEGHGVEPDIVVDNPPRATYDGSDAQLAAAVEHLLRRIEEEPVPPPLPPDYPDKSFQGSYGSEGSYGSQGSEDQGGRESDEIPGG